MSYLVGIDLGGTNIAAGIVTDDGTIICEGSVPTNRGRGYELIVKDMAGLIEKLMQQIGLNVEDIRGIGIGSPGIMDVRHGSIVYSCNLEFNNAPLCSEMQKYFNVPVYLDNDANCAALAESLCGAARNSHSSVTVTIGTGIGGGVIIEGKIFSGFNYSGGEIGHMVIQADGEWCSCGRQGCWEAYSSATALIRDTKKAAAENTSSIIHQLVQGDLEKINAKVPFDAAKAGDETAKNVLKSYFRYFATGIVNMINIFQPDIIVIGGGVCKQGDYLIEPIQEYIDKESYSRDFAKIGLPQTRLKIAQLGNHAGIVGAAMLVLEN